jgi:hypothetical protein
MTASDKDLVVWAVKCWTQKQSFNSMSAQGILERLLAAPIVPSYPKVTGFDIC